MVATEQVSANRALQTEMYGAPLSDLVGRIGTALGLSQARMADVIGMSPAMLSQLCSGQRVKIGNPAVVERLRSLDELARSREAGRVTAEEVPAQLEAVKAVTGTMSRAAALPRATDDPLTAVRTVQGVLRAVASAEELLTSAELIEKSHPAVAEVLQVYGAGRTDAALDHFARIRTLL